MAEQHGTDPWDPDTYPWHVQPGFPVSERAFGEGHRRQLRLLAEHRVLGGSIDTGPRPELKNVDTRVLRPFLEGVRQARWDAATMGDAGTFDGEQFLRDLAEEDEELEREQEERDLSIGPGHFAQPADWSVARLHTTVTRLFTDRVVHDVTGEGFEPRLEHGMLGSFSGPVMLLGRGELDLGVTLDGDYRIDLINAATNEGGSGVETLRLLWGAESSIVGAVYCGELNGYGKWVGVGPAGAAREFRSDDVPAGPAGRITIADTPSGNSYWFASGPSTGGYSIYLAVDSEHEPVGMILDSSGVAVYYWFGRDDVQYTEWPHDAREFDVRTDTLGFNPNIPLDEQEDL